MKPIPPDTLNRIGVLTRREVEARILLPFIQALSAEFDGEKVREILRQTIIDVARQQGAALADQLGRNDLAAFAGSLEAWKKDDAMEMELLQQSETEFHFNVTRCRYAEMYQALGIPELGAVLSCNRDYSLIEGFNPQVRLVRTQTLMEGAPCCDFRYSLSNSSQSPQEGE